MRFGEINQPKLDHIQNWKNSTVYVCIASTQGTGKKTAVYNYSRSDCSFELNINDVKTLAVTILNRRGHYSEFTYIFLQQEN